jgi:hypothetical protein
MKLGSLRYCTDLVGKKILCTDLTRYLLINIDHLVRLFLVLSNPGSYNELGMFLG